MSDNGNLGNGELELSGNGTSLHRALVPTERQRGTAVHDSAPRAAGMAAAPETPKRSVRAMVVQAPRDFAAGFNLNWLRQPGVPVRPFLYVSFASFMAGVLSFGFIALVPAVQHDLRFTSLALVTVLAFSGTLASVVGPVVGFYGDRVRRLRLLSAMAALASVTNFFSAFANGLGWLLGGRMLFNASSGLIGGYSPIKPGVLADFYAPEIRGRVFGSSGAIDNLAGVVGPILVAILTITAGWRVALIVLGVPLVVSTVLLLTLKEPVRGSIDKEALGMAHEAAQHPDPPPKLGEALRTLAAVRTLRRFWYAWALLSIGGPAVGGLITYYFLTAFHIDVVLLTIVLVVNLGAAALGNLYGGGLVDRLMRDNPGRAMIAVGAANALGLIGYVALSTIPVLPIDIVLMVAIPFAGGLFGPASGAVISMVVPARVRTFAFSTLGPFSVLGSIALGVAIGVGSIIGVQGAIAIFIPIVLAGSIVAFTCAPLVQRDIDAEKAAVLAAEAAREARLEGHSKILVCRHVDVVYAGGVQVLFNVDFDVRQGEIVALLGTNGAGKSTLLRAISGLTEAANGAIFFDGRDITHLPTAAVARAGVVQVLGGRAIFPRMTVAENLEAASWLTEDDPEFLAAQRRRILDELFPVLMARLHERAGTLSGGEQQMLALSQAFLMKPKMLMIDELSLGLSPAIVGQLLEIVRAIHAQGTTIILVEQSVNVALTVATRAVFMEKGEIRFDGQTSELLARPDLLRSVYFASAQAPAGAALGTTAGSARATTKTAGETVVLQADGLTCRFGGVLALNGAHLTMRAGEIVGIIGPNGAGKSTLLDAISGFVPIESGTVALLGADITNLTPDHRARLGLIRSFQDGRLFPALTVTDNIAIALERYGVIRSAAMAALWLPQVRHSEQRVRRRATELIELLGLQEHADKYAGELSTGSRRVVDLACMLAAEPEVLLLDEPSSGIAQAEVLALAPLLERVRRETGCAIGLIEHDMTLITAVSDRIVAMELGAVLTEGSADAVLNDPRVVAAYLGTSEEAIARSGTVAVGVN